MGLDARGYPTTVYDSAGVKAFIQRVGMAQVWLEGVTSMKPPAGSVGSRDKTNFDSENHMEFSPGLVDPGEFTLSCLHNPSHPGYIELEAAQYSRETATFEYQYPEIEYLPVTTLAVDGITIGAGGVASFSGTGGEAPNWSQLGVGTGAGIKVGAITYLVKSINPTTRIPTLATLLGAVPAAVAVAAPYSIVRPRLRSTFAGFVMEFAPGIETDANSTAEAKVKVTGVPQNIRG